MLSHEDQIVAAIRQIIRAVDLHSRQLFDVHGMTGPQLAVLQEAKRLGPTSPTSLARAVHLSQATVTGILKRLERRLLIDRQPSPDDRRSVLVSITDKGQAILEASPSLLQDRFRNSLSSLEEWERLQILATMQRVAMLMDADNLDASPHLTPGDIRAVLDPAVLDPAVPDSVSSDAAAPGDLASNDTDNNSEASA
ncbi:MarR family transcriptional regulator [Stieleria sp. TO1_6]|uniref:MarR family winged helix-turn-helix transcriptional regulator n=1 Tax=Stieleria tagensis TaxID=2956795 RepID=UPI00209AA36C|nr:MarR family transcriptional regulator [Stieleria tagensis]MCO8121600.1 MarR family transcriptional regulator [Stieleria tagensis]